MATEGVLAGACQESGVLLGVSRPHHGEIASTVDSLHPHKETHPVQPAHGRRRGVWLGVRPEDLSVVHAVEDVLDVTVRGKDQGRDADSGHQTFEVCVVSECSQLSRSGPVTAMTPRWERSTTPCPVASSRCSRMGSPKCQGTPASIPSSTRTRPDCEAELMCSPAPTPDVFFPGNCDGGRTMPSPYDAPRRARCRSHPSEPGPHMRLERLAGCRLVERPQQIPLDVAVEPLAGRVVLG